MHESRPDRLSTSGVWQENEEQAWRLWTASAGRAAASIKHKRHTAAEIYWRSAFDIARRNLDRAEGGVFSPVHLLEPLQGLVDLLLEQGKWMAARSLYNEVVDFLNRRGFTLTDLAERVLNATAHRVAQAQMENMAAATGSDNIEDMPQPAGGRLRHVAATEAGRTTTAYTGSAG